MDDVPATTGTFFQETAPLVVTDLGQYQVRLGVRRADGNLASFFLKTAFPDSDTTLMLNYDEPEPDPAPPAPVDVLFRFYPDGTQIGALQEGEVVIFQACNYQGKAAVFALDTPSLAQLTSPAVTLDKSAASIRLGNNTGVILHTKQVYTGTQQIIEVDTPCLTGTPIGNGTTSSLQIRPLAPTILLSSRSCENCQLLGADVSGLDLSGADLEAGVDLKGANLTGATLTNTNLSYASLEQAILDQVSGAMVNLSGAFLTNASLRKATLGQAKLYGATLLDADLEGADLGGAFLSNCNEANCSPEVPSAASLVGAHLKNVNLANADLSGADFSNASFYSSSLTGTGKCTFSNGNCATASGATMNNTQFYQAYLAGVDFTGTNVQGVQFDGAVLIGANFSGATLQVDPTVGTNSGFQNAFLQGTQLGDATLTGTSLAKAFLDFRPGGNDMFLLLSDDYAGFPNWHAPNQPICVFVIYSAPTTVPIANMTLTCPNTEPAGSNGCGAASPDGSNPSWNSTLPLGPGSTPPASYLLPATYTNAATPICSPLDSTW